MDTLTLENPVFASFAIAAALMVLKLMGQGWMTVFRMIKSDAGLINPEDLRQTPFNKSPRPDQLDHNDYVDRSRRMQRNDLENIPAFWAAGLLFVTTSPPLWLANLFFYGFVLARLAHSWAYVTQRNHETRAAFFYNRFGHRDRHGALDSGRNPVLTDAYGLPAPPPFALTGPATRTGGPHGRHRHPRLEPQMEDRPDRPIAYRYRFLQTADVPIGVPQPPRHARHLFADQPIHPHPPRRSH